MKILFVHSSAGLYGADRCLLTIAKALISRGHDVFVVVPEDGPLVSGLRKEGAKIRFIDPIVFRREVFSPKCAFKMIMVAPFSLYQLYRLIKTENFDLVHSNTSVTIGGAVAAKLRHTPHIWHFREILTEFGPLLRIYEPLIRILSTRLIFITGAVADQFSLKGIREKGRVINDGISVADYECPPEELQGPTIITSVGRLAPYKGQDVLIKALAEVNRRGIETKTYIVGDEYGDRHEFTTSLQALIEDLGMAGKIHLVGFQEDVKPFLEKCNMFVMPANRQEPLGIVMLEAMAARRAVIATGGGGVKEIIEDGVTGVTVDVGNHMRMADAIVGLATEDDKRLALAGRGQQAVRQRFSQEAMFKSVLNLYEEILYKHKHGSSGLMQEYARAGMEEK